MMYKRGLLILMVWILLFSSYVHGKGDSDFSYNEPSPSYTGSQHPNGDFSDISADDNRNDVPFSDAKDDDGNFQGVYAKGNGIDGFIHRHLYYWYSLTHANYFEVDGYEFNNIKDSEIHLYLNGRLDFADITSDVDNNKFKFYNPLGHSINYSKTLTDSDSLSDIVERRLNLDPNNPDVDNDGLTDSDELLVYGTNPLNANSGAMINGSVPLDSTYIALMKSLFEEYTKTLNPIVQNIDTRNIPLFEYMHFSDSDADGLSDFVEITNGLDPNDPDMDSDGYKDGYEIAISGTNPREADTDIDGLKDSLDLDPLINQEALLHMLPVIGDNYITIIADKDESFQLDVNPEDLYVNSNDSIQILMGNEQTKFQFNMSGKDSSLHMLRTPDGYSFEIRETTLRTSGLEFVEASNLTIVNVSMEYDVECLSLAPIGRYTWEGDFANEAFSVYVHNLTYSFCIQKSPDQFFNLQLTDCSQCGLYSFAFKQVFTRAMFEFEKKMEKFDYFSDAITSKGRYNTYNFSLDPKFNIVTEGNYDNFIRRDSIIHSSFFKIHNYDEMFFELLTAPIIGQFIQLLSIDGANITATHNVMTVTYNDERLIIVGEDTPEQDEVLARMRSFR